jgi:peptidyl-prolyl cis-trans isomerase SurA
LLFKEGKKPLSDRAPQLRILPGPRLYVKWQRNPTVSAKMTIILSIMGVPVKLLSFLMLLGVSIVGASCGPDTTASDDIVARVNGNEITTAELEKQFQNRVNSAEQPPAPEEVEDLKLQLLSQLINDEILLELASQASLTATDAEVDVKFNEFKSQYTEEQFQKQLADQKMSVDEIRAELRKSLTIEKLVNKEITSKISVSDAEIQAFYDKNKESFNLPETFRMAHILVTPLADPEIRNAKNDDAKTAVEARDKAIRLLRDVQGGADFAVVARDYSEDPTSASVGGDLNFQALQQIENIDPRLAQAVQRLRTGETAPQVIETRFGFHIIKLLERDPGGQKDLSDPRIQAEVRQVIFNRKDQTLKAAFSESVRNRADVSNFMAERILANAGKTL